MAKTITLRLEEAQYLRWRQSAGREHRSLANWIETMLTKHLEECQWVDDFEMAQLRGDRALVMRLKQGSRDTKLRRGHFIG